MNGLMKKMRTLLNVLLKFISLAALLLLTMTTAQGVDNPTDVSMQRAAETVLVNYFKALKDGDLTTVQGSLGPALLKRREGILSNPEYSAKLVEIHKNTTYTITGYRLNNNNTLAVFVNVERSNAATSKYLFTMQNIDRAGLRIILENELL